MEKKVRESRALTKVSHWPQKKREHDGIEAGKFSLNKKKKKKSASCKRGSLDYQRGPLPKTREAIDSAKKAPQAHERERKNCHSSLKSDSS